MISAVITSMEVADIRFPTSVQLAGSDAKNPDPDYSAAYVVLTTDNPEAHKSTDSPCPRPRHRDRSGRSARVGASRGGHLARAAAER
jgi:hypothetical protein